MQVFKLSPEGVDQVISKNRFRSIAIMLISTVIALIIFLKYTEGKDNTPTDLLLPLAFMLVVAVWSYMRAIKRQKKLLATFIITVNENNVTRQQINTPVVSIAIADIKEILRDKKGNLVIKANENRDIIYVPAQIDDFPELEALLHQIKPIGERNPYPIMERYPIAVGLLTAPLMLGVYLSTNKIIVGVTGTLLLVLLIWSFYQTQRTKHVDDRTKRRGYFLLLVMVAIVVFMIKKLTGIMPY
ncbi:hypothetical protein [Chitinophaga sp. S165]|uniref:hypothetical protein n=1 Tax=Chitinophaga sp. S165 TaxID=2135462 RepID=UPI000D711CFA|nr:hypothetical protein [Chitinophaga sp. S165]PWV56606.1 hypothetical protein C7475_1011123 [Chitinophaga sp. S165]